MRYAPVAAVLALGLLASPGLAAPLSAKELKDVRSRAVIVLHREPTAFELQTPGRMFGTLPLALLGPVGSIADIGITSSRVAAAGKKVVDENAIEDPANFISRKLAADLLGPTGLGDVRLLEDAQSGDWARPADFRPVTPEGMLIVEVRTARWVVTPVSMKLKRYGLRYKARVSVLDPWRDWTIATVTHSYVEKYENAEDAPTLDELLANDAAMLKQKLQQAAETAADQLRTKLLAGS